MEELRVPKRQARVELRWPGGKTQSVAVYLAEFASTHTGAQRISELLNGRDAFVPAFDVEAEAVVFLRCTNISVVRVQADLEPSDAEQHTLPQEHEVRITLMDGTTVSGLMSYVRPPGRERVMDFLNEESRFFPLLDKDQTLLVNKEHVARVDVLSR
ncbi:MAG: hypothetical protein ACKVPX_15725 [Myxococcaceae bacterium]